MYICAKLMAQKARNQIAVIPPGMGKSFIILFKALYYASAPNTKVYIITANELLAK